MKKENGNIGIHKLTLEDIDKMQAVDLRTTDRSRLKDIQDVAVDMGLPQKDCILDFIRQIGNTYCCRHGNYVVRISFAGTDVTLEERMVSCMQTKC